MLIPRNLKIEWQCTLLLKTYFFSTRTTGFSHYCARHKISNEFIEHKNKFFCVVDILTVLCGNSSLSKCVNSKKFEDWMTVQSIVKNIFFRLEKLVFRIAVLDTNVFRHSCYELYARVLVQNPFPRLSPCWSCILY